MILFHKGAKKMVTVQPFYKIEKKHLPPTEKEEKKIEHVNAEPQKEVKKPAPKEKPVVKKMSAAAPEPVKVAKPEPEKKPEPVKEEKGAEREYGKIVVYTCITGGYDELRKPVKTEGVDFICFTDDMNMASNGWTLRPMPDGLDGLTTAKKQRMVKILPHKYLPEYDISIYVDGSFDVKANVKEFLNDIIYTGYSIFIPTHPSRDCIYKECEVVKKIKKDTTDLPDKQMKKYREEGFPERFGLTQNNVIVRWHNNEDCIEVMEVWADQIRNFSHRDQLSFFYALWKTKATCFKALDKKTCDSKYFHWNTRHGKKKTVVTTKKK